MLKFIKPNGNVTTELTANGWLTNADADAVFPFRYDGSVNLVTIEALFDSLDGAGTFALYSADITGGNDSLEQDSGGTDISYTVDNTVDKIIINYNQSNGLKLLKYSAGTNTTGTVLVNIDMGG